MHKDFNAFLDAKGVSKEEFSKKSAEDQAGLFNEYNDEVRAEIAKLQEKGASKEEVNKLIEDLKSNLVSQQKALNETLKEYGLAIKAMNKSNQKVEKKSLLDQFKEAKDKFAGIKSAGSGKLKFKAPDTILLSTNVSGGNVPVEDRIPGLDTIASRRVRLLNILSQGSTDSTLISWVSQANKDGAAGQTAEGATKNQIDFDLVVGNNKIEKTTAYVKVSDEALDDVSYMETEIRNELTRELLKAVESQVYNGDGVSPNLEGVRTVASAFVPGSFATGQPNEITNPNNVDVLTVAMNQIKLADQEMANYILMNPTDVTVLKTEKRSDTDKDYVSRLLNTGSEMTLDGVPIIETTLVAEDEYLVGAFDLATLYQKESPSIQVGYENDDFTKNLVTLRAEWRGAVVVKTNQRNAFVKGTFSTDKAAIAAP